MTSTCQRMADAFPPYDPPDDDDDDDDFNGDDAQHKRDGPREEPIRLVNFQNVRRIRLDDNDVQAIHRWLDPILHNTSTVKIKQLIEGVYEEIRNSPFLQVYFLAQRAQHFINSRLFQTEMEALPEDLRYNLNSFIDFLERETHAGGGRSRDGSPAHSTLPINFQATTYIPLDDGKRMYIRSLLDPIFRRDHRPSAVIATHLTCVANEVDQHVFTPQFLRHTVQPMLNSQSFAEQIPQLEPHLKHNLCEFIDFLKH